MTNRRTAAALRPQTVTRALRADGFVILPAETPRSREGIRVSNSGAERVSVAVDLDTPGRAARLATEVAEALTAAGYLVEVNPHSSEILYVSRAPRYGKSIPAELRWLRGLTEGEAFLGGETYSPNRLRQLVELGALVETDEIHARSGERLHRLGAITDEMIKTAEDNPA